MFAFKTIKKWLNHWFIKCYTCIRTLASEITHIYLFLPFIERKSIRNKCNWYNWDWKERGIVLNVKISEVHLIKWYLFTHHCFAICTCDLILFPTMSFYYFKCERKFANCHEWSKLNISECYHNFINEILVKLLSIFLCKPYMVCRRNCQKNGLAQFVNRRLCILLDFEILLPVIRRTNFNWKWLMATSIYLIL